MVYGRWDFKMHQVFNYGISEFATDRCTVTLTRPINDSGSIEKQKNLINGKDTTDKKVVGWHEQTCDAITIRVCVQCPFSQSMCLFFHAYVF